MKIDLNRTIGLLEQALKNISPDDHGAHDVRLHITRALHEAKHLIKKQATKVVPKDQLSPWERWRLDLESGMLIDPKQQKLAVNILDNMIDAEQQKLEDLASRKKQQDANISRQTMGQQNMGTLLG